MKKFAIISLVFFSFISVSSLNYLWLKNYDQKESIANRIATPSGFTRIHVEQNSFAGWLRHLPLKPANTPVKLYNGELKGRQDVHHAVIDIDAGPNKDLQQCADAVMRLRAEYLLSAKKNADIHFKFTSGDEASWNKWKAGWRARIKDNKVSWIKMMPADSSYKNFMSYMEIVFNYAGTSSLSKELKTIQLKDIQIGDVFIEGGFPGHAVIVVDMAEKEEGGEKLFMLAQSYMPAQNIHILKNLADPARSPWFSASFSGNLETPEWTFTDKDLKRFHP